MGWCLLFTGYFQTDEAFTAMLVDLVEFSTFVFLLPPEVHPILFYDLIFN